MDTQNTNGVGDQNNLTPSAPVPAKPVKSSMPVISSLNDPPANLPMVSGDLDDSIIKTDKKKDFLRQVPKVQAGVRGPLPTYPNNPIKLSGAKFGIGLSLKKSIDPQAARSAALNAAPSPDGVKQEASAIENESENKENGIAAVMAKPKIGVPRPPVAPLIMDEMKPKNAVLDDELEKTDAKIAKNIPLPTAPSAVNVDRNIRPRRLAIVVIVLLFFVAIIFFSLWYFFTMKSDNSAVTSPDDKVAVTSEQPDLQNPGGIVSPTPGAESIVQTDSDGDGLTDTQENQMGTNIFQADSDGDGYNDKQEIDSGYDPLAAGGKLDTDRDGLADPDEQCWGTELRNPDTDGDGYLDGQEVVNGYNPMVPSPADKLSGPAKCQN